MQPWVSSNADYIKNQGLSSRVREVPDPDVTVELEAGRVYATVDLRTIDIADGVRASVSWGRGTLMDLRVLFPKITVKFAHRMRIGRNWITMP